MNTPNSPSRVQSYNTLQFPATETHPIYNSAAQRTSLNTRANAEYNSIKKPRYIYAIDGEETTLVDDCVERGYQDIEIDGQLVRCPRLLVHITNVPEKIDILKPPLGYQSLDRAYDRTTSLTMRMQNTPLSRNPGTYICDRWRRNWTS